MIGAGVAAGVDASVSRDPVFDRPAFILSPPRSGSTLLFERLAQATGAYSIGGESHRMIEQVPGLGPRDKHFDSNVLDAADAGPSQVRELRQHFLDALRDRDGRPPASLPVRMLEKTPKNALRVPFLQAVFPESRFVYLHRDARETIGSMMDAWLSGRFRTYVALPGWPQAAWSMVLVPGWRALAGKPLHELVAFQWRTTINRMLDALEQMPADRWCAIDYATLLRSPAAELRSVAAWLGLAMDRDPPADLPLSRHTLTTPAPGKWRKHAAVIEPLLPELQPTVDRARRFLEAGLPRRG